MKNAPIAMRISGPMPPRHVQHRATPQIGDAPLNDQIRFDESSHTAQNPICAVRILDGIAVESGLGMGMRTNKQVSCAPAHRLRLSTAQSHEWAERSSSCVTDLSPIPAHGDWLGGPKGVCVVFFRSNDCAVLGASIRPQARWPKRQ